MQWLTSNINDVKGKRITNSNTAQEFHYSLKALVEAFLVVEVAISREISNPGKRETREIPTFFSGREVREIGK